MLIGELFKDRPCVDVPIIFDDSLIGAADCLRISGMERISGSTQEAEALDVSSSTGTVASLVLVALFNHLYLSRLTLLRVKGF